MDGCWTVVFVWSDLCTFKSLASDVGYTAADISGTVVDIVGIVGLFEGSLWCHCGVGCGLRGMVDDAIRP